MPTSIKVQEQQEVPLHIEKQLLAVDMLPVEQLVVDHNYQRDEDPARVQKMIREWDWNACGHLAVSLRKSRNSKKNVYAVIDGQQRLLAIRQLGYSEAPCRIYADLTQTQEAELYEKLNNNKKPSYNDLFKSRIARKEEAAIAIKMAVESVGYHLDFERNRGGSKGGTSHFFIQTMLELEQMYHNGGVIHIMDTLKLLKECFAGEPLGKQAMILSGFSRFLRTYPEANRRELVEKVRRTGQLKLVQNAMSWAALQGKGEGSKTRGRQFSEALLLCYNYNRQEANKLKSRS